jgi:FtsP/CotA-like multicopper oxidase with cupredoxin domain
LTFNGTIPGPAIIADWGDNLVIHVTNNLEHNGTSIHWHGLRQLGSSEYDGVPGVTQCPIAPGGSMTYRFRATQYGSTWYHSHFSLQYVYSHRRVPTLRILISSRYAEGLLGPLILNGPATSNYDEDLGLLFLQDWSHTPIFQLWDQARAGGPPTLNGGLINGTNTFDCSTSTDPKCIGGGKKFEAVFVSGNRYRIRLINVATEGHFQFSIDGHNFTVIANDLVPLVPYQTDSLVIGEGQRYDIIVEANAEVGDYWLRAGWQPACSTVKNAENITGIIRYDANSTADPVTTSEVTINDNCADEPLENLVPYLAMNVGNFTEVTRETLSYVFESYFMWTINTSSLYMNWSDPTTLRVIHGLDVFPTEYNVVSVEVRFPPPSCPL